VAILVAEIATTGQSYPEYCTMLPETLDSNRNPFHLNSRHEHAEVEQ